MRLHPMSLVLLFVVFDVTASGCKLLGLQPIACEPDNLATCPGGQVCDNGACVGGDGGDGDGDGEGEGKGEGKGEGEGEAIVVVVEEPCVELVVVDADDQIFYASDVAGGCIKRKTDVAAAAVDMVCEAPDRRIMSLAVLGEELFFLSDGAGATDRLRVIGRDATTTDTAVTLSANDLDIGALSTLGPDTLVVRVQPAALRRLLRRRRRSSHHHPTFSYWGCAEPLELPRRWRPQERRAVAWTALHRERLQRRQRRPPRR